MFVEALFWISVFLLGYTHVGYPTLLWVWAALRARESHAARVEPMVTVLVVAHNEATRIRGRIENLLDLDYPRDRLEIILASDGSDDDTLLRAQAGARAGIAVAAFSRRRGKSAMLNDLIPRCRGEIVVLADARQRFDPGALRALAARFADRDVGAVSGELMLTDGPQVSAAAEGIGFYWRYEKFIRRCESRIDSTVGVTGAIYAIRRELFEPIPEETILDDVLIPMRVVRRGYRVVFEPSARAYDRTATADAEFTRKVRTLAGNFQLFTQMPWLLNPASNRLWVQTVSHKACRLLSPLCLAVALAANACLIGQPFYRLTLGAQLGLYAAALMGYLMRGGSTKFRLLNVPYVFCLMNWATVVGFVRFVSGRQRVTWGRTTEQEMSARRGRANAVVPRAGGAQYR